MIQIYIKTRAKHSFKLSLHLKWTAENKQVP